jgi:Ca2+-binding RTX toxin-like protein
MTHNSDGSTTINGLLVTDADNGASSETFGVSLTTNPSLTSGSLSAINTALASGMTYSPGATPPATATVTLSISDVPGATETVNFVFNQAGTGQNIPVQGTSGNDVIFATTFQDVLTGAGGQDQFVFTPVSSGSVTHTVTDFTLGIDKLDLRQFSNVSASSLPVEAQLGNDTLITLDASDTILLKNVVATNLHASDFIMHT